MSDYTPTTEEVRAAYEGQLIKIGENRFEFIDEAQANSEFDRWLAEHDRQVAEKAWGQGAAANIVSTVMNGSRGIPRNPYRQGEEQ